MGMLCNLRMHGSAMCRMDCANQNMTPLLLADMDGFKLLEHIGLELDLPVISE